jgi:hypothetical protein
MLEALAAGASHPAVAGLLGLGASGLAGGVVAMAWNVHVRQIRLAEQLARRQLVVTAETAGPGRTANGMGDPEAAALAANGTASARQAPKVTIEGPGTVVTGEQVRYRVRAPGSPTVVSWAAGGGSVAQAPDPAHPDELLLIADQPGDLMVTAWVREGLSERRATKPVTAVPDVTPAPPLTLRLFLHGWGLLAVAVLIIGFAGALVALGNLSAADFIALAAPLAALLGVTSATRGTPDPGRGGAGREAGGPRP